MFGRKSRETRQPKGPIVDSYVRTKPALLTFGVGQAVTRELVARTDDGQERSFGYFSEGYGGRAAHVLDAAGIRIIGPVGDDKQPNEQSSQS